MDLKPELKEINIYNPNLENALGLFFSWWYAEEPIFLRLVYATSLKSIYHLFSIPYLLKTLISPWKRDVTNVVNPTLQDALKMFTDNLLSRFIGFFIRFSTIVTGLVLLAISFVIGLVFFIFWYLFPLLIVGLVYYSFYLIGK